MRNHDRQREKRRKEQLRNSKRKTLTLLGLDSTICSTSIPSDILLQLLLLQQQLQLLLYLLQLLYLTEGDFTLVLYCSQSHTTFVSSFLLTDSNSAKRRRTMLRCCTFQSYVRRWFFMALRAPLYCYNAGFCYFLYFLFQFYLAHTTTMCVFRYFFQWIRSGTKKN